LGENEGWWQGLAALLADPRTPQAGNWYQTLMKNNVKRLRKRFLMRFLADPARGSAEFRSGVMARA
jgi:hypothetical protein